MALVREKPVMTRKSARIISGAIILFFVLTVALLDHKGRSSRTYGGKIYAISDPAIAIPVAIVENASGFYEFYKSGKVHGRVLVHVGKYLHFIEIENDAIIGSIKTFPIRGFSMLEAYERLLDHRNYLWVAMQGNLFREIWYVLPETEFREKAESINGGDPDVVSISRHMIVTHEWGARRVISDEFPFYENEPVILNIDASLFDSPDCGDVIRAMRGSKIRADIVSLDLAVDNPEVTEGSRERLRQFASSLSGGVN